MTNPVSDARILGLIAAYGASPVRWPEGERAGALARIEAAPDLFAAALDEARAIDLALECAPFAALPAGLVERVIAAAPLRKADPARSGARDRVFAPWRGWLAGGALACLSLGLVTGYFAPVDLPAPASDADTALVYAFLDTGLTELDQEFGQ